MLWSLLEVYRHDFRIALFLKVRFYLPKMNAGLTRWIISRAATDGVLFTFLA